MAYQSQKRERTIAFVLELVSRLLGRRFGGRIQGVATRRMTGVVSFSIQYTNPLLTTAY
jgi:hypothetical protein